MSVYNYFAWLALTIRSLYGDMSVQVFFDHKVLCKTTIKLFSAQFQEKVHGYFSSVAFELRVGASLEEELADLHVVTPGGDVEGSPAVAGEGVGIRSFVEQELYHFGVSGRDGVVQGRGFIYTLSVNVGSM